MTFKIGDYVEIWDDPITKAINGMAGKIVGMEEWHGRTLYKVEAENYGPYMTSKGGTSERKVRAWKRGDWRRLESKHLRTL